MTSGNPLGPGEVLLTDHGELVWRNVNPAWVTDGGISSQAFRPTPKDEAKLSSAREQKVSAAEHFREFTEDLNLDSVGVWAVSVGEANANGIPSIYDEHAPSMKGCPTGHTSLDFTNMTSKSRQRRVSGALRDKAEARGTQFEPPS